MSKCDCYHTRQTTRYTYHPLTGTPIAHDIEVGVCWGTRETDECDCGGDRIKCDFYPEVREKAKKEKPSCYKYKNPGGHMFIWCEVANGKEHRSSYLNSFQDIIDDYYENYNYCPYCGNKLEEQV